MHRPGRCEGHLSRLCCRLISEDVKLGDWFQNLERLVQLNHTRVCRKHLVQDKKNKKTKAKPETCLNKKKNGNLFHFCPRKKVPDLPDLIPKGQLFTFNYLKNTFQVIISAIKCKAKSTLRSL